ncbi:MAG: C40 family peptidase [Muribaculaceae bacterium]|nr:C40 family peptidase [Muribaculaceae bacterium]
MKKNRPGMLKKNTIYLLLFLFTLSITSCKSHKKNRHDDTTYIGEQVEVKKKKKEKKGNSIGEKIAAESLTWLGTPYGYGHQEKGIATDCSGLVLVVYELIAEVKLPRNSAQQADFCKDLKEKEIKPGDLVFFATGKDKKKVSHVGVMIDEEKFVHASSSKGVILSEMSTPYYRRTFIKYGRVPR